MECFGNRARQSLTLGRTAIDAHEASAHLCERPRKIRKIEGNLIRSRSQIPVTLKGFAFA